MGKIISFESRGAPLGGLACIAHARAAARAAGTRLLRLLAPAVASCRRGLSRLADQKIFYTAVAATVLVTIWGTTLSLIAVEYENAGRAAATSTLELTDTYEAQMLRNLREIDQTLKLVKYAYESTGRASVLTELGAKGLLPPDLLFVISIADDHGRIRASTRARSDIPVTPEMLEDRALARDLWISGPRRNPRSREWELEFSTPLHARDGRATGLVTMSVEAAYFVSGYEAAKLGERGLLGLVGANDNVFRVRRSGETITAGDDAVFSVASSRDPGESGVAVGANRWDGVSRFTAVRLLYAFPLGLVVGLAEDEQLAAARANVRAYAWRAGIASVFFLLFMGALARVSWKLAQAAKRESEAKLAHAERVQYLAYHDGLTNLPNRALFSKMLEQGISHARRHDRSLAVLFLDLDRFKHINDTLGHQFGDHLLKEIALRLQNCLRDSDTVARLGGDEFVVLLPEFEDEKYVATVAQKLLSVVSKPFEHSGQALIGTTSVGIAVYPRDGEDEQTLMKYADTAMYHAKELGKNNYQFYSSRLQANSLERLKLETSLRQAIQNFEFELYYQPKVDLATNAVTAVEALVRWHHREHGTVAPSEFIPIAEDTGLIVPIGRWALETACAQMVAWQKAGLSNVRVAVNLSAGQFNDEHLLNDITDIIARTGIVPSMLELEITESMLMHNVDRAVRTLTTLREIGVRVAIDDFGTGYSSLSNLKRFPINTLKIDRSFISDLPHDADDCVITQAIIGMARALRLRVVAEGVETDEQLEFLREHACDAYQGYYFSKPLAAGEIINLIRSKQTAAVLTLQRKDSARAATAPT